MFLDLNIISIDDLYTWFNLELKICTEWRILNCTNKALIMFSKSFLKFSVAG
jgi:hypothetical protein